MQEFSYPKLKYQGVAIQPGQHHTVNPGYIYQLVKTPDEEDALEGDWFDTPRDAIEAFKGNREAAAEQRKAETIELQGRERGIPPAGGDGGGAPISIPKDKGGVEKTVGEKDEGGEKSRKTEDWPTESEKRRRH